MTFDWLQSKKLFNLKYAGHCKLTVDDDNNDVMVFVPDMGKVSVYDGTVWQYLAY